MGVVYSICLLVIAASVLVGFLYVAFQPHCGGKDSEKDQQE
jgi:hypothetical protein